MRLNMTKFFNDFQQIVFGGYSPHTLLEISEFYRIAAFYEATDEEIRWAVHFAKTHPISAAEALYDRKNTDNICFALKWANNT